MSIDVVCPGNKEVVLQAIAAHDSTFNIKCPFNYSRIEDWGYACSVVWNPVEELEYIKHCDDNGNVLWTELKLDDNGNPIKTGRKLLSATDYEFRFPYKISGTQNNSIGWFNSWGMNSGTVGYTLGNTWKFDVKGDVNMDDGAIVSQKVSGRCGLNPENEMYYGWQRHYVPGTYQPDDYTRTLIIRNNNAIFDYFLQGPGHSYLKIGIDQQKNNELDINNDADVDVSNFWINTEFESKDRTTQIVSLPYYYYLIYGNSLDIEEKSKQAKANGIVDDKGEGAYPYIKQDSKIYLTPSQIENDFGVDMNEPSSFLKQKYKKGAKNEENGHLQWRIYGAYWYNGVKKYMECDNELQEKFNNMMSSQALKANYQSFRLLITYVTQLNTDIIYDNIDYANIVLEICDNGGVRLGADYRWVVGDTIFVNIEPNRAYLPGAGSWSTTYDDRGGLSANMEVTLSTPPTVSKPNFLINRIGLVDFPCYKFFGETIEHIYADSFSYDSKTDKTTFNIVLDGLVPTDIEVTADGDDWRVLNRRTAFYIPELFNKEQPSFNYCYSKHTRPIRTFGDTYPVSKNIPEGCAPGLYLQPSATYLGNDFYGWDNPRPGETGYQKSITLMSRYPMTPNAAVRFIRKMIITVEVDGDHILKSFDLTSESSAQTKTLDVKYNGLAAQTKVEKLDNTIPRSMNGVTLQPYMYDATKLKVNYKLTAGEEITLDNSDITLTISDNTGAGKGLTDIKLSDIVNRDYDDFIYCTGLAKNEADGCYEITIYMAAKASDSTFNGKGFNDSTVMVRFNINEYYKKAFSLMDVDYNVVYITTLPPYLIQGIPFTRSPADEKVLNSNIAPENSAARVDFLYDSYADNNFGYKEDAMFSNSNPLYVCIASAFVPNNFNGTISGVNCTMYDTVTKARYPIAWESANNGANQYVVLTSADNSTYKSSNTEYSAMANIQLWTFEQTLDIPSVRARHGVASNIVEISAHLDYTSINEELEQQNMVTIRSTT